MTVFVGSFHPAAYDAPLALGEATVS
jgi:hypothetical protein